MITEAFVRGFTKEAIMGKPLKEWAIFKRPGRAGRIAKVVAGKAMKSPLAMLAAGALLGRATAKKKED